EAGEIDDDDKAFIDQVLQPRLEQIQEATGEVITRIRTCSDRLIGNLLISEDQKASLIVIELSGEFMEHNNRPTIEKIEHLIDADAELQSQLPPGISLTM